MKKNPITGILAACAMLVIILDGKTAFNSAQEGVKLCLYTVIPALFPFFILSCVISSHLLGKKIPFLLSIGKLCKIPQGSESLLLVGFLSGYPVGAQLVTQAYKEGNLQRKTAQRMLGFCSNAGPAFLFGMLSPLFRNPLVPWCLWAVHITSALLTGWLLPGENAKNCTLPSSKPISFHQSLLQSIKSISIVCGWVIIFRIILGFFRRWFLWMVPTPLQVLISGLTELSNGCIQLHQIPVEGIRFILAGVMIGFGGLCVIMQTCSVTQGLGLRYYFPGKLLQTLITTVLCCLLQKVIFPPEQTIHISETLTILPLAVTAFSFWHIRRKKVVAIKRRLLYNTHS